MKIATWNVNGIRARGAQLCDWIERDRPDVVCLQELKATPEQVPEACKLLEYHVYRHGARAYSGVSLHVKKELAQGDPLFTHPEFDMETRIVQVALGNLVLASVYVPNGGKDYPAKINFMRRLIAWTRQVHAEGKELVLCGDMNTNYGTVMGSRSLVRSLATLFCAGHRQRFFRGELFAALNVQNGDIAADALKGSWAGAFGQTQFMPTTFQRLAVDFDGDGPAQCRGLGRRRARLDRELSAARGVASGRAVGL